MTRTAQKSATIEVMLIALDRPARPKPLLDELRSLHRRGVVKIVDAVLIHRHRGGPIEALGESGLSRRDMDRVRRLMSDALGFRAEAGDEPDVRYRGSTALLGRQDIASIAQMLTPSQSALAVILEHEWSSRFGRLLHTSGVKLMEDYMLTPDVLRGVGPAISMW